MFILGVETSTSRTEVGSTIVNPPSAGMLAATHKGRDQEVQTCLAFSLASLSLQPFKASWKLRKDKFQLKPHHTIIPVFSCPKQA
jgi:hypothetical protein